MHVNLLSGWKGPAVAEALGRETSLSSSPCGCLDRSWFAHYSEEEQETLPGPSSSSSSFRIPSPDHLKESLSLGRVRTEGMIKNNNYEERVRQRAGSKKKRGEAPKLSLSCFLQTATLTERERERSALGQKTRIGAKRS